MQNRKAQLHRPDIAALTIEQTDYPRPGAHEVLVNIEAASLNFLDLMIIRGDFPTGLPFPYTPLSDGAGVVVEIGEAVTVWKVGDRVALQYVQNWLTGDGIPLSKAVRVGWQTQGILADYVCVPDHGLVKLPDTLSFEAAATLPIAGVTAWEGLINRAQLRLGQTVLVQGTGGVSIFALQLAKSAGARVIATTSSAAKADKLRSLGADEVINYSTNPDWHKEVLQLTDGEGVDVTLDIAGKSTIVQSLQSVKVGGMVCTAGGISGADITLDIYADLNLNFKRLVGFAVGSAASFSALLNAMEINRIQPVIDSVYPMDRIKDAFRHLESGGHFGKIVIDLKTQTF